MPNFTIIAADGTWVVRADGAVIGESTRAVRVVEADGPGAIYFPRDDLGMAFLEGSGGMLPGAALGDARLFNIVTTDGVITDAAWSYEAPRPGAERIAGLIAFDAGLVAVEENLRDARGLKSPWRVWNHTTRHLERKRAGCTVPPGPRARAAADRPSRRRRACGTTGGRFSAG